VLMAMRQNVIQFMSIMDLLFYSIPITLAAMTACELRANCVRTACELRANCVRERR
jgi:hypothetical protein